VTPPSSAAPPPLRRREGSGPCPLSFAQERLWFLDQLEPQSPLYNIARAVRLRGPLDLGALQAALDAIAARHEAIRTALPSVDGRPLQLLSPPRPVDFARVDLDADGAPPDREAVLRLVEEEARRPFDLSRDLMLRGTVFRLRADEHILLLAMHHVASDGWSLGLLAHELSQCYTAHASGRPPSLPDLPIQYADYAQWQRDWLRGPALERALAYWKKQLADLAPLELPGDRPRPARQSYRGARERFRLPAELTGALKALGRQTRTTLFMTLLATFQTLLHRYSGRSDFAVGCPVAGRTQPELEPLIGFFVNTLVLRGDLSGDPTFRELLGRVREMALSAYEHQDLPFEKLVAELRPERTLSHTPLFQVMLAFDSTPPPPLEFAGLAADPIEIDLKMAKSDLILYARDTPHGLAGSVEYSTDLFEAATIRRMLGHFETLLAGAVADPDQRLSALPLLTAPEWRQIVVDWNDTRRDYPADQVIHELFAAQALRTPDAVALVTESESLSYGELNRRANQLAHRLRALGVRSETPVAICAERSLAMIVGLLGILKAGGAYVPLDPAYPRQRLAYMLEDTRAPVLVTQERVRAMLPDHAGRVLCLDADWPIIARESGATPTHEATPESLAYVMYTSGSTGRPKGVSIPHRAVVRLVKNTDYARLTADEVFLQLAPLAFDASTFEIWGSLLNGARLAIFPPGIPSVAELGQALRRHQVTTLWLTAAFFHELVEEGVANLGPVRQLLAGGDALSVSHVKSVLRERPGCELINGYGPTESTTFACCFRVADAAELRSSVPIGRPIANTRGYVLDPNRRPVPIGVPGELHVGGDGLARGYLNRPDLTAEQFIPDPFSDRPDARLYRTGDLVRYRPDGNLEFLGRLDHQVKIRGFRVEPGEVEAVLREHPRIRDVVVVARKDRRNDKSLVAYLAARGESAPSRDELRQYLSERLPAHMIPSGFIPLADMPLTPSGKVDRQALPVPSQALFATQADCLAPRNTTEAALVEIWEDVLGAKPVGVTDDFFHLGGHSLLAVRMFAQLHKKLGRTLPLATLFQAPTIASLAALLGEIARAPESSLVKIAPAGSRPPVFAVPGVGGNVLCYRALAQLMGPDQPFFGLQSQGLDGSRAPLTRIEDIAAAFLRDVRAEQPEGPYHLVGTCMGGVVVWEMAQQLLASGQTIGLLALLETWPPARASSRPVSLGPRGLAVLDFSVSRVRHYFQMLRGLHGHDRLEYLYRRIAEVANRLARGDVLGGNRPDFYLRVVSQANLVAFERYEPRAYTGPVVFVRAGERRVAALDDRRLAWRSLSAGGLEIHTVPAEDSGLLLVEPHVHALAEILRACLEQSGGAPRARLIAAGPS
jgi:amino acid adenylation domain-containing protein